MPEDRLKPQRQSRRTFLKSAGLVPAAMYLDGHATEGGQKTNPGAAGTMIDQASPPMEQVRVGLIGMGRRGLPMLLWHSCLCQP